MLNVSEVLCDERTEFKIKSELAKFEHYLVLISNEKNKCGQNPGSFKNHV